jgi:gliding motility-associated-like protein
VGRTAGNISVKAFNNCGEGPARQLAVAPSLNLAATPPAIDGSTEVCAGEQVTYSTPQVTGSLTYVWQVPADWTILAGQGSPALQVRVGKTAGQVEVKTRNGCGDSSVRAVMVAVHPGAPALPAPIAGPAQVCSGKTGLVYTTAAQPGVKAYSWQVPDGWTITAGQGTSTILVTAGTNPGPITVQAANSCGLSQVATLPVTPTRPLPATLGPIISSTAVICQNQQQVSFRVADLPGTVSYTWQLPADWIITAGQGTHAILVTAGTTAGKVSVKAQNACDGSAAGELEVQPRPVVPLSLGAIAGSSMVCSGQRGLEYAIGPVSGAQTYTWSLPAGWVITSGQGTEKITVIAGQASGSVTVVAANSCVQTPAASLAIASMPAPGAPAIRDLSNTCDGLVYAAEDKTELNTRPPVAYTWTVPPGWIITNGQGTRKISVTAPAGSTKGLVAVTATNGNCPGEPVSLEADPALAEARISIANAITANGDGHNDNWDIANLQNYPDNEVVVLNRWGNEVYRKKAYANNWNGGQLNAGTYFYQLKVKVCDGSYKSYQGYVMVLR